MFLLFSAVITSNPCLSCIILFTNTWLKGFLRLIRLYSGHYFVHVKSLRGHEMQLRWGGDNNKESFGLLPDKRI